MAKKCIYYSIDAEAECNNNYSYSVKLICYTCNNKILKGILPEAAEVNNLKLKEIPEELLCLNDLEEQLIARHIPFKKLRKMPEYKQNYHHIKGPVVCVPANLNSTMTSFPNNNSKDHIFFVKLKRNLSFKNHESYRAISLSNIKNALNYLIKNNIWYSDVEFNDNWTESNLWDNPESENDMSTANDKSDDEDCESEPKIYNTCLMPVDLGQEILDFKNIEDTICLAPSQGNKPVPLLNNEENEAKSFPTLFPDGKGTFYDKREKPITLFKYIQTMIMNSNNRFARHPTYLFFAQYISEVQQVHSSVSIAMRKGESNLFDNKITKETFQSSEKLREILKSDQGYKFLKPIRGTPAFWESTKKDIFAMIRQLGIPTWFLTFSAAESRWPEVVKIIMKQNNDERTFESLTKNDINAILRSNPVTAARMFDHKFQVLLNKTILKNSRLIGKVIDYFYRVEFQQRGSAHVHCIVWVENAPKFNIDSNETITKFIDKYITCALPDKKENEKLHEIVSNVQRHSYRHTKSCAKKNKKCRYSFPRPPCKNTFITHISENKNDTEIEEAKQLLKKVIEQLDTKECNYNSIDAVLNKIDSNYECYKRAFSLIGNKNSIILKRNVNEVWIN